MLSRNFIRRFFARVLPNTKTFYYINFYTRQFKAVCFTWHFTRVNYEGTKVLLSICCAMPVYLQREIYAGAVPVLLFAVAYAPTSAPVII